MSRLRGLALTGLLLSLCPLAGCVSVSAATNTLPCASGETQRQVAELAFGRNIGDRLSVSEADFTRFLDEEVSPRFPDGLTVWDSQGRWLDKGVLWKEPGKVMSLILRGPDDRRRLDEVAAAYEARFNQDAVLIMIHPACVTFHTHKPG
ncbi:MAG: DUF3574 domain-containing protein [Phenylobacterium sp.]